MSYYRHITTTKGVAQSKVFRPIEKPGLDLDAIERQTMLDKEAGNSKTRIHICHMVEIIRRLRLADGVSPKEDLRRIFGS